MRNTINAFLGRVAARKDLLFLAFIFVFVLMFIVPVPPAMIDALITLNIALTLVVLIAATYLRKPTDLSTFPAIILFSTVFRLAITVASSRLILAHADAGDVIKTFGTFVIGGKLMVGLIVFLIVAIVLFIVVVKGVERIAEVGARFTLDALPGRQMSIDSDLRNGDITKEEARARRTRLGEESQFFGAMDGAMRFVKGDAIAGFVIIFVNLLGGILIGMTSRGMSFGEASRTYSLLTVGEGLVSQIPAMLVAIAAGVVVTRVVSDTTTDLGSDISAQLIANRQSLVIAGGVLAAIGFLPGFPTITFLIVSIILVLIGLSGSINWMFWRKAEAEALETTDVAAARMAAVAARAGAGSGAAAGGATGPVAEATTGAGSPPGADSVESAPATWPLAERGDIFQLATSPSLATTVQDGGLPAQFATRSGIINNSLGFDLPPVTLRVDATLPPDVYRFEVEDVPVFTGHWRPEVATLMTSRSEAARLGVDKAYIETPTLGGVIETSTGTIPATAPPDRVLDAAQRLVQELEALLRRNASAAFGFSEASAWLTQQSTRHPQLVAQVQQSVPTLRIVELCRRLLDEGVSLSPPRALLEAIIRTHDPAQDVTQTVEAIRKLLRRQIVHSAARGATALPAFVLEPDAENRLSALSRMTASDLDASRPSGDLAGVTFARVVGAAANEARNPTTAPVLVTTSRVRAIAQAILKRHGVLIPVLSLDEIGTETQIRPLRALTVAELGLA